MSEKTLLTPDEFAELANVTAETVRRLCRRGEVQAVKVGRQWRIHRDVLETSGEEDRNAKAA